MTTLHFTDSSCEENVDSSEEIEKTDVTKSKSPKKGTFNLYL